MSEKRCYTVQELQEILGVSRPTVYNLLKKTDRYWLVHKNVFESKEIAGKMRINIASFEKWYANQIKYHKVTGEELGKELKAWSYSVPEMARLLGLTRSQVYQILRNPKYSHFFETIVIAEKKRITKESFQKFLEGQDLFHLDPANDYEELAQEQNIVLANFRRKKLSQTGVRGSNGNLGYLTFDEASYLAKVSRSLINKWETYGKEQRLNPHSYRLKGRDFVHQGKIEIDVNERAVFIRTQGCFFDYTNSDCFLNSLSSN